MKRIQLRPKRLFQYVRYNSNNPECKHVVLSDKAYAAIIEDVLSNKNNETGGLLIGNLHNRVWYVVDVVDAGIDTKNTPVHFQWDNEYVNHLFKKLSKLYRYPLTILGFWHRHPDSMDYFSMDDERTIYENLQGCRHGLLSMLVNIDPKLRMTFYYCQDNRIMPVGYDVGDEYFPKEILEIARPEQILRQHSNGGRRKVPQLQYERILKPEYTNKPIAAVPCIPQKEEMEEFDMNMNEKTNVSNTNVTGVDMKDAGINITETVWTNMADTDASEVNVDDLVESMRLEDEELITYIERMEEQKPQQKVLVPEELELLEDYEGPLYGYIRPDTGCHVVLGWEGNKPDKVLGAKRIGYILKAGVTAKETMTDEHEGYIVKGNGQYYFWSKTEREGIPLNKEVYGMIQKLFSRNAGLMESDYMRKKCVLIAGCGSVGSLIALQMARSGVGRFILIDPDCIEINNVCRHQCNLTDIGRYKVDAVADRILQINPKAEIIRYYRQFQKVPVTAYQKWMSPENSIMIGTADNRVGNAYVCDMAYELGVPFAAMGFMARAWAAEIFTALPEKEDICYRCAFLNQIEQSIADERRNHLYIGEEDKGKVNFEPGLDVDIEHGVSMFDKIVLDILNRDNPEYHPRIYHTLKQLTVLVGTDDMADEFWKNQLDPLEYAKIELKDECRRCEQCKKAG